jgi:hypothetical protein
MFMSLRRPLIMAAEAGAAIGLDQSLALAARSIAALQ